MRAFPIHFFRHFCRRVYRLATFAVRCQVQPQHTAKTEPPQFPRLENPSGAWSRQSRDHGYSSLQTWHFGNSVRRFGSATIPHTSYAIRSTILTTATLLMVLRNISYHLLCCLVNSANRHHITIKRRFLV